MGIFKMPEYGPSNHRRENRSRTFFSMVTILFAVLAAFLDADVLMIRAQPLSPDFYNVTCPQAQTIVRNAVAANFNRDHKIAAHLLRLQFHDCAATGCDASLLLNGTLSEQSAPPNLTLEGFDLIEGIKAQLEANCSGIVSCADILALAARDSVALTGGPNYPVPVGRFDTNVSGGSNVNLIGPSASVPTAIAFFQDMGLTVEDLVVLLGAHTIGEAHCSSFSDRLSNFENTSSPDPRLNTTFLALLQQSCPTQTSLDISNVTVALDFNTEFVFDTHLYTQVITNRGVLQLDQELLTHNLTRHLVFEMAINRTLFSTSFASSMVRMGQLGVLNATSGHIRTRCFA